MLLKATSRRTTAELSTSVDATPWAHPFLTADEIRRFRTYSENVWQLARLAAPQVSSKARIAFAVNMAQNMYKWARMTNEAGWNSMLYLNPQDRSVLSRPEWEEFDGEYADLFDGDGFLATYPNITVPLTFIDAPNDGTDLWLAYHPSSVSKIKDRLSRAVSLIFPSWENAIRADRRQIARLRREAPSVRHIPLLEFQGAYAYYSWAKMLANHDVIYIASTPFPAYASGKPYCIASVGGDMQFDCGRSDDHGRAMRAAFAGASFIFVSNPHTLAHCRRLGLSNAVYLPYPMDSNRYSPGEGNARKEWVARYGGEVFVLTTARIDSEVKGHTDAFFNMLVQLAKDRPQVRFIFLGWGVGAEKFKARVALLGLSEQLIMLPPVGKKRLIDYYRSCDIVLDQFVYGYYGATALEAASIGKPIVMKLRTEQYAALYDGDVAPVINADTPEDIYAGLVSLIDSKSLRDEVGEKLRQWLLRNHGEEKTIPLMLALLQIAADGFTLPSELDNPLLDKLSSEEKKYHKECLREDPPL